MDIRQRVERLLSRMHDTPQYPTQGAVLFVDLERQSHQKAYLSTKVVSTFLAGRGGNMFLLYNLLQEDKDALDPEVPLIFGTGILTSNMPAGTRGNVTSRSPESHAILDSNAGDYFPTFLKRHGYDHLVVYGKNSQWTLLNISQDQVSFLDATPYLGMDNIELTETIEQDFDCTEQKDMAMARITSAGENRVLCSGIMGGIKAIWARGGAGAKMGALNLKAVMIKGKLPNFDLSKDYKLQNKEIGKKILSTSVIQNALKTVGTPFLYKPSRVLGAMGTKNNQETTWHDTLDADNFDPYRPGMSRCYQCPVRCRADNDMLPGGKGGWGASALTGIAGNASYDKEQSQLDHHKKRTYNGINDDGVFDKYDKGEGPEYIIVGKFGPNIGIKSPEQVLRLNNILNDLALDASSTGASIAWAMELYQRGIINKKDTGGLDLIWGNYPVVEQLLFMTAKREGFGDTIADSAKAVENGKYPVEALQYRMAVKGLFQSDPHDSRILKAFALGLAVATRGMDHLRNRVTLEINARINDDAKFKTELYGGVVAPEPNGYQGKEYAVRRCEDTYAVGDSIGMCRFNTKLFNSPSLPDLTDFAEHLNEMTGLNFDLDSLYESGRSITGLERMLNFRLGLRGKDDTLPRRWFDEPITVGPFKGEKIDREEFEAMKTRFYKITGLNTEGVPALDWHRRLSNLATGYAVKVDLPEAIPGAPEQSLIIDEPVSNVVELRQALLRKLPEAREQLENETINIAINGDMVLSGEQTTPVPSGSEVTLVPIISGG
ncbi:aldehyde ferredoxin oxidoreductase C-terminal domain-containing protein [Motiliproteus sp. MSK22-1]|uniref:aldehyde ferredoxin oxidoreductase C-terminal domain-containing protein n=1 Tax=Motiliproteus sp. MSK22-1 TaxID=1897630 RepID=UPI000977B572|nr:aldehyde ferredoxin oxidoreductase C-terminal domain-containing protein [Motiliproteus sp. MSK22-1]OMH29068.1 aldehyde ferredoxin oxidoreductase [Motiliproteus sp. MSK22-1]